LLRHPIVWCNFRRLVVFLALDSTNTAYVLPQYQALEKQYPKLKRFPDLGRLVGVKAVMRDTTFQSSAFGKRENVETTINGRVIFDLLPYMFRNHKLSSYSLNSVSAEFLGTVLCGRLVRVGKVAYFLFVVFIETFCVVY
jgi:DNA polymerase delta subunit 1